MYYSKKRCHIKGFIGNTRQEQYICCIFMKNPCGFIRYLLRGGVKGGWPTYNFTPYYYFFKLKKLGIEMFFEG